MKNLYLLIIGSILAFGFFLFMWKIFLDGTNTSARNNFNEDYQTVENKIYNEIEDYSDLLYYASALFAASEKVTGAEWTTFVNVVDIQRRYPGIRELSYLEKVPKSQAPSYIAELQNTETVYSEYQSYRIFGEAETNKDFYLPVKLIEPFNKYLNNFALGFDHASEVTRLEAIELAVKTGNPTTSNLIKPITSDTPGVAIYFPVYNADKSDFRGIISARFFVNDLFDDTLGNSWSYSQAGLKIYDGSDLDDKKLFYETGIEYPTQDDLLFENITPIKILNNTWTLHFYANKEYMIKVINPVLLNKLYLSRFVFIAIFLLFVFALYREIKKLHKKAGDKKKKII